MNRALPLFAAVVLLGGGLALLATQTGPVAQSGTEGETDPNPSSVNVEAPPAPKPEAKPGTEADTNAAPLAAIGHVSGSKSGMPPTGGYSEFWEVTPMNGVGQQMKHAKVTAIPGDEIKDVADTLTGEGRMRFENVPAGPWELTVTAEECPTWNRVVVVPPSTKRYRTMVHLGAELRVLGQLRDTNGDPLREPIYFLAKGHSHPVGTDTQNRTKGQDGASETHVLASPAGNGRFKVTLPSAGSYRVSVGEPGAARWTDATVADLTHGGTDHVTITVPAKPKLTATFSEKPDERPTKLSVYYYDAEKAAEQLAIHQRAIEAEEGTGRSMSAQDEEERALRRQEVLEKRAKKDGDSRPRGVAGDPVLAPQARRDDRGFVNERNQRPLFQAGWRNLRTMRVPPAGELVMADLPPEEELRFLLVRKNERITTMAPMRLSLGQRMAASFSLPVPTLEKGTQMSDLATYVLNESPTVENRVALRPGTEWSFGARPKR